MIRYHNDNSDHSPAAAGAVPKEDRVSDSRNRRWSRLQLPALVALAAAAALGLVQSRHASTPVLAAPPNRLYGSVTLNGAPAPVGAVIAAQVDGKGCASSTVLRTAATTNPTQYPYSMDVPDGNADPACKPGAVLTFRINGILAAETHTLDDVGTFRLLNLTAPGTPNVPAAPATTATAAPAPTATPAPAAGTALVSGCNELASPYATGTLPSTIAVLVSPPSALMGIWRYDPETQLYRGYIPAQGAPIDLGAISKGDILRICVTQDAQLSTS